jgi:hypothetical protein
MKNQNVISTVHPLLYMSCFFQEKEKRNYFLWFLHHFCIFLPLWPPEGSLQPSIIPVTKPTNSHRSTIGWGEAGFESGTLGQLLSHQTVQYLLFVELPHLPERILH